MKVDENLTEELKHEDFEALLQAKKRAHFFTLGLGMALAMLKSPGGWCS
jgi:hypothetical protein